MGAAAGLQGAGAGWCLPCRAHSRPGLRSCPREVEEVADHLQTKSVEWLSFVCSDLQTAIGKGSPTWRQIAVDCGFARRMRQVAVDHAVVVPDWGHLHVAVGHFGLRGQVWLGATSQSRRRTKSVRVSLEVAQKPLKGLTWCSWWHSRCHSWQCFWATSCCWALRRCASTGPHCDPLANWRNCFPTPWHSLPLSMLGCLSTKLDFPEGAGWSRTVQIEFGTSSWVPRSVSGGTTEAPKCEF